MTGRNVQAGDLVLTDTSPWIDGGWADTANAVLVGTPDKGCGIASTRSGGRSTTGLNSAGPGSSRKMSTAGAGACWPPYRPTTPITPATASAPPGRRSRESPPTARSDSRKEWCLPSSPHSTFRPGRYPARAQFLVGRTTTRSSRHSSTRCEDRVLRDYPGQRPVHAPGGQSQVARDGVTDVLVKLTTDDGLVGWGEACSGADAASVEAAIARWRRSWSAATRGTARRCAARRSCTGSGSSAPAPATSRGRVSTWRSRTFAARGRKPLWRLLGGLRRREVTYFYYLARGTRESSPRSSRTASPPGSRSST